MTLNGVIGVFIDCNVWTGKSYIFIGFAKIPRVSMETSEAKVTLPESRNSGGSKWGPRGPVSLLKTWYPDTPIAHVMLCLNDAKCH